jgi:hypothetical protein
MQVTVPGLISDDNVCMVMMGAKQLAGHWATDMGTRPISAVKEASITSPDSCCEVSLSLGLSSFFLIPECRSLLGLEQLIFSVLVLANLRNFRQNRLDMA